MNNDLETIYGPPAPYSEHTCGDFVMYVQEEIFYTGSILYIAVHRPLLYRAKIALRYIVMPSYDASFPEVISPSDIVIEDTVYE